MDVESAMSSKLVCRVCGAGEGNCQRCPCPSNREEKLNFRIPGLPGGKAATPSDVDPETLFDPNEDEADDPSFLGYRVNCIEGVEDCVRIGRSDRFAGPMDGGLLLPDMLELLLVLSTPSIWWGRVCLKDSH